jgi:hypothetical protein
MGRSGQRRALVADNTPRGDGGLAAAAAAALLSPPQPSWAELRERGLALYDQHGSRDGTGALISDFALPLEGALGPWRDAVRASRRFRELEMLATQRMLRDRLTARQFQELLSVPRVFARAYAQWQHGGPADTTDEPLSFWLAPRQRLDWDEDDFAPIAATLAQAFPDA